MVIPSNLLKYYDSGRPLWPPGWPTGSLCFGNRTICGDDTGTTGGAQLWMDVYRRSAYLVLFFLTNNE